MPANSSVQRAHDALLVDMPADASHNSASCPLCQPEAGTNRKAEKEVAQVPETDAKNVYTEDQHFALLTAAVERETSALTEKAQELEAKVTSTSESNTELQTKVDTLEAEVASLTAARDEATKAFEDFKAELAEKAEIEARKSDRIAAVKAANSDLAEDYFDDERVTRWAAMSDDAFGEVLAGIESSAKAAKGKPAPKADGDEDDAEALKQKARETAAFTGGASPTAGEGSVLRQFLTVTGALPAQN